MKDSTPNSEDSPKALRWLALAYFTSFASGGLQLPLTTPAMTAVGLSMSDVGWMWAARNGAAMFAPAVWGLLADRRGDARPFAILSLVGATAILLALSQSNTALVAIFLFGAFGLIGSPSGSMLDGMVVTALGKAHHRFGHYRLWGTIGFGLSAALATAAVQYQLLDAAPSPVFVWAAACNLFGAFALAFVPKLRRPALASPTKALTELRRPELLSLFAAGAVLWAAHLGYVAFLSPLSDKAHLAPWTTGASITAAVIVETLVFLGAPRWLATRDPRRVLGACALLSVLRWTALAFTTSSVLAVLLHSLHGFTFGLLFAALVHLTTQIASPEVRQTAQATLGATAFGLGGVGGSLLVGSLLEQHTSQTVWLALAGVAVAGFLLTLLVSKKSKRPLHT